MGKNYFLILVLLVIPNLLLAQYIGLFAKNKGKLCFEKPIFTDEDAALTSKLINAKKFSAETIERYEVPESLIKRMTFTEKELKALKGNFTGYEVDDYFDKEGGNIPDDFYAIGTTCKDDECVFYHPKYKQYENWTSNRPFESAMIKMMTLLQFRISKGEKDNENTSLLYDYRSLSVLFGIVKTLKETCNADEFAIMIASY